ERGDALGLLQVERDRALVPMRVLVVGAVLAAQRVVAAHVLGHLDLDHVGAPVGELAAGSRTGANLGEVDDPEAAEGRGCRLVRHTGSMEGPADCWRSL